MKRGGLEVECRSCQIERSTQDRPGGLRSRRFLAGRMLHLVGGARVFGIAQLWNICRGPADLRRYGEVNGFDRASTSLRAGSGHKVTQRKIGAASAGGAP